MKLILLIFLSILNLHALTISEYVDLALKESNKAHNLKDDLITAKLNLQSAKHRFDFKRSNHFGKF